LTGENVPALIPAAIDQDPFWRITRDIASSLGIINLHKFIVGFYLGLVKAER
jgi:tryptophanyl-tRNA synthetase